MLNSFCVPSRCNSSPRYRNLVDLSGGSTRILSNTNLQQISQRPNRCVRSMTRTQLDSTPRRHYSSEFPSNSQKIDSRKTEYTSMRSGSFIGSRKSKYDWTETHPVSRNLGTFRVVSYNIMADAYNEPAPGRVTIPKPHVQGRMGLVMRDLEALNSDIFCLQEVERGVLNSQVRPLLNARGYDLDFCILPRANDPLTPETWKDRIDGNVVAWKTSKFNLISTTHYELRQLIFEKMDKWGMNRSTVQSLLRLDNPITIALLETTHVKVPKKKLCLATIHGHFGGDYSRNALNALQTQLAVHAIRKVLLQHSNMDTKRTPAEFIPSIPVIFAGDFNARPGSGTYQYLSKGFLAHTSSWLQPNNKETTTQDLSHHFKFASAYGTSAHGEPKVTHVESSVGGVVDYLWYTPEHLTVHKLMDVPNLQERLDMRLPTVEFPSDHIPVGAEFSFTPSVIPEIQEPKEPEFVPSTYHERIPDKPSPLQQANKDHLRRKELGIKKEAPAEPDEFEEKVSKKATKSKSKK